MHICEYIYSPLIFIYLYLNLFYYIPKTIPIKLQSCQFSQIFHTLLPDDIQIFCLDAIPPCFCTLRFFAPRVSSERRSEIRVRNNKFPVCVLYVRVSGGLRRGARRQKGAAESLLLGRNLSGRPRAPRKGRARILMRAFSSSIGK